MTKLERTAQPILFATPTAGMLPRGTLERLLEKRIKVEEPLAPKRAAERYTRPERYAAHVPVSAK